MGHWYIFHFRNVLAELALDLISSMWSFQVRWLSIMIPRYLAEVTCFITVSAIDTIVIFEEMFLVSYG